MRGTIRAIAPDGSYGEIETEHGQRMSYWSSQVVNGPAQPGQRVEFEISSDQPVNISIENRLRPPTLPAPAAGYARQGGGYAGAVAYPDNGGYAQAGPYAPQTALGASYWIELFTSPSGRISRRQFWLHGFLPLLAAEIVLGLIPLLNIIVVLVASWAWIALAFKRFHDRGLAGWWCFIGIVPTILAAVVAGASYMQGGNGSWGMVAVLYGIGLLTSLAQLVMVYARAGVQGPNQYGPDPLARAA